MAYNGSLILLDSTTVTSATPYVAFDVIDATYKTYVVTFNNVLPDTDNSVLYIRARNSSGDVSAGSLYYQTAEVLRAGATSQTHHIVTGGTQWWEFTLGTGYAYKETTNGQFWLFNWNDASEYSIYTHESVAVDNNTEGSGLMGGGSWLNYESLVGIKFLFNTGNIAEGKFSIYGLAS